MYLQGTSGKQEVNLEPSTTTTSTTSNNNHSAKTDHPLCLQGMGEKQEASTATANTTSNDNHDKQNYNDDKNGETGNIEWRSGGSGWQGCQAGQEKDEEDERKEKEKHFLLEQGGMQEEKKQDDSFERFRSKIEENMRKTNNKNLWESQQPDTD
jgi:hypothetical protein